MIDYSVDECNAAATLEISGMVNIQQAHKLHAALLEIVGKARQVTLRVAGVTGVDLSVLQLLCAAHRRLQCAGGGIILDGEIPSSLRQAIINAGFSVCAGDLDNSRLWIGEMD